MRDAQYDVRMFMEMFGQEVRDKPGEPTNEMLKLRKHLMEGEVTEFNDAIDAILSFNDIKPTEDLPDELFAEYIDALGDIIYVALGGLCEIGVDAEKLHSIIHKSNMSKFWTEEEVKTAYPDSRSNVTITTSNGVLYTVRDQFGKVIKPPSFKAPGIKSILD